MVQQAKPYNMLILENFDCIFVLSFENYSKILIFYTRHHFPWNFLKIMKIIIWCYNYFNQIFFSCPFLYSTYTFSGMINFSNNLTWFGIKKFVFLKKSTKQYKNVYVENFNSLKNFQCFLMRNPRLEYFFFEYQPSTRYFVNKQGFIEEMKISEKLMLILSL